MRSIRSYFARLNVAGRKKCLLSFLISTTTLTSHPTSINETSHFFLLSHMVAQPVIALVHLYLKAQSTPRVPNIACANQVLNLNNRKKIFLFTSASEFKRPTGITMVQDAPFLSRASRMEAFAQLIEGQGRMANSRRLLRLTLISRRVQGEECVS